MDANKALKLTNSSREPFGYRNQLVKQLADELLTFVDKTIEKEAVLGNTSVEIECWEELRRIQDDAIDVGNIDVLRVTLGELYTYMGAELTARGFAVEEVENKYGNKFIKVSWEEVSDELTLQRLKDRILIWDVYELLHTDLVTQAKLEVDGKNEL